MIKKLFREMLLTQVVSSMTVTVCMLIDSIMIGRFLGVDSVSAYGLATPLLLVFAAFGSLISAGVQVLCGKTMGRGDREGTNAGFTVSMTLGLGISLLGVVLVFLFLNPLTRMLGADPGSPVFTLTRDYIVGFILGAPAFLLALVMVPYMQFAGRRTRLVAAVGVMCVSDVVFDLLNVFVFHGGTLGMGLASTASYYVALVIGIGYFFRKDCMFRFRRRLFSAAVCRELFVYGFPTVVNQISLVLLIYCYNQMFLSLEGTVAVAAYSVVTTIGNICYCFGSGVGSVAMMLAAIFHAERDRSSIRELIRVMIRWAVVLDVAVTVICVAAARPLISLFLADSGSVTLIAVAGLRLFILSMIPSSINSALKSYYQGINLLGFAELISVLQNFVFAVASAFLLSRFLGISGVWLGYLCGETLTLLFISVFVFIKRRRFAVTADNYSLLDENFDAAPDRCFERTVQSVGEAAEVSRLLCDFCREKGMDARTSMLIGLCVEEMTVNIVEHGFTKDRLAHNIDVRLVLGDEDRVIRIRDNCTHFDPTKYLELHRTDDPAAHIGLRMVMGMVREANYVNSFGLNNLTLKI